MKKLYILLLMLFMCMFSVNAVNFIGQQEQSFSQYYVNSKGNNIYFDFVGSLSQTNDTKYFQETDGGGGFWFDFSLEIAEAREDFYLILQNVFENETINVWYRGDLTKDPTLYRQDILLQEAGRYVFKFEPEYLDEPIIVYINASNSFVGSIQYTENKPESFGEVISIIVTSFTEIIDINVGLWTVTFYVFLLVVSVGFVTLLFYIAFKIFEYSKQVRGQHSLTYDDDKKGEK